MNDQAQTPEELAAHYGPDGPVAAASDWLAAVLADGDYAAAWALMSDDLRLARAQAWLWNNREFFQRAAEDLDEQADMLAAVPSEHPYWDEFAEIETGTFIEAFPLDEYANVGISSKPRPLAPGLELVLYIPMSEAQAVEGATPLDGGGVIVGGTEDGMPMKTFAQIVVEHDGDRWIVASHNGEQMPQPGWPPVL